MELDSEKGLPRDTRTDVSTLLSLPIVLVNIVLFGLILQKCSLVIQCLYQFYCILSIRYILLKVGAKQRISEIVLISHAILNSSPAVVLPVVILPVVTLPVVILPVVIPLVIDYHLS